MRFQTNTIPAPKRKTVTPGASSMLDRTLSATTTFLLSVLVAMVGCIGPRPAVAQIPAEKITFYHNDLLGSPVAATCGAGHTGCTSGQVLWRESYKGYGAREKNDEASAANKVWYTSRHQDEVTGLVYMGARYYDPTIGRFMSTDEVRFQEENIHSFNRYAYANNNPYRFVDPDGKNAVTAFGGLLYESYSLATGQGFNGSNVWGALKDGYNGEGAGFWRSAGEDVLSFGAGAIGAGAKLYRLAKVSAATTEVSLGQQIFSVTAGQSGFAAENVVQRGATLTFENFTVASVAKGRDLVGPAKELLAFAKERGAKTIEFRGTYANAELAEKFGARVGDSFSISVDASRSAIVDMLRRF